MADKTIGGCVQTPCPDAFCRNDWTRNLYWLRSCIHSFGNYVDHQGREASTLLNRLMTASVEVTWLIEQIWWRRWEQMSMLSSTRSTKVHELCSRVSSSIIKLAWRQLEGNAIVPMMIWYWSRHNITWWGHIDLATLVYLVDCISGIYQGKNQFNKLEGLIWCRLDLQKAIKHPESFTCFRTPYVWNEISLKPSSVKMITVAPSTPQLWTMDSRLWALNSDLHWKHYSCSCMTASSQRSNRWAGWEGNWCSIWILWI